MKTTNSNPETSPKLKRFLAFYGSVYYPRGGWGDFLDDCETLEEAKKKLLAKEMKECPPEDGYNNAWKFSWAQIFDTETKKIVWTENE